MNIHKFNDFLKITEFYKLKKNPRNSSNHYHDEKDGQFYKRRETTSEHVQSCGKLVDYFIFNEREFSNLDRMRVHDLLNYHDDVEIITRDAGISEREEREEKKKLELEARVILSKKIPNKMQEFYLLCDQEYRDRKTDVSLFANAVDK